MAVKKKRKKCRTWSHTCWRCCAQRETAQSKTAITECVARVERIPNFAAEIARVSTTLGLNVDCNFANENLEGFKNARCDCEPSAEHSGQPSDDSVKDLPACVPLNTANMETMQSNMVQIARASNFGKIDSYRYLTTRGEHDTGQLKKFMAQHKTSGTYSKLKDGLIQSGFSEVQWAQFNTHMTKTDDSLEDVYAVQSSLFVKEWLGHVDQLACVFAPPSEDYIVQAASGFINDQYLSELVRLARNASPTWDFSAESWLDFMLSDPVIQLEHKNRAVANAVVEGNTFAGLFLFFSPFSKGGVSGVHFVFGAFLRFQKGQRHWKLPSISLRVLTLGCR